MAKLLAAAAAAAARLLTGDALALTDVELLIADDTAPEAGAGAAGTTAGDGADPPFAVAGAGTMGADLPGEVPLMLFVASFTSWNFSINCKQARGANIISYVIIQSQLT